MLAISYRTLLLIGKAFEEEHEDAKGREQGIFIQAHLKSICYLPWYTEEEHPLEKMGCLYNWKRVCGISVPQTFLDPSGFGSLAASHSFYKFLDYWRGKDTVGFDKRLTERLINDSEDIGRLTTKGVSRWLFYVPDRRYLMMFCAPFLENDSIPEEKFFLKRIDNPNLKKA
jgi:hypothetical protein